MQGYSPKLPLFKDSTEGTYIMNHSAKESIAQDLKMLVLTNPGERMMNPSYGVGLKHLLFSQNTEDLESEIKEKITSQVANYMSFISIEDIQVQTSEVSENGLYIILKYYIPALKTIEELNLTIEPN